MPVETYRLVARSGDLPQALATIADLEPVGVDVERADWDRYFRAAALIQVGGDGRVVIVDPLSCEDLSALATYLSDRTVVLHALENDLVPLEAAGLEIPKVADTAIAAAVLGLPTGLDQLHSEVLAVELSANKAAMQRADWEERPLTEEMLAYAAADVADLPRLWLALAERLDDAGRRGWYEQELHATLAQPSIEERRDWSRTKGLGRLDPHARARARRLWEQREDLARQTDTAPGRIVSDRVLVDLATRPPKAISELGRRGVRRHAVRAFGDDIMAALDEGRQADPEPPQRAARRVTDEDRALADELRAIRADIADDLGIDAGLLCPSKVILRAVLTDPSSENELRDALELRPWQWELLAEPFTAAVLGRGQDR